jgi:hypothetical protein
MGMCAKYTNCSILDDDDIALFDSIVHLILNTDVLQNTNCIYKEPKVSSISLRDYIY